MSVLGGLPKKCYFYVALVFVAHNLDQLPGKKYGSALYEKSASRGDKVALTVCFSIR